MARDLRRGSRLIRWLQLAAVLISCAGAILALMLLAGGSPGSVARYVPFILIAFILNGVLVAVVFGMQAARGLVKRIKVLAGAFDRGAEGDLTVRVDLGTDDELSELGQNFNAMLEKLAGMVAGITASIDELRRIATGNDAASEQALAAAAVQAEEMTAMSAAVAAISRSAETVASGVATLARSAEENCVSIGVMSDSIEEVRHNVEAQAGTIDDVSTSITEIVAVVEETNRNVLALKDSADDTSSLVSAMDLSIQQVERNTRETVTVAEGVRDEARQGKEAVEATISGIGEIRTSSGNTFTSITRLSERVAAIGKIVSVIDELTEQTNLLALNSAITAAQAGEHGKGFAIVSGEIKELANRTKRSTREIEELIGGIREETDRAVAAIRATEERVADGEKLSRRSGEALNRIVNGVQVVTDQINEIARATVEQAAGSRQIHTTMGTVADRVGQISLSCREQAATSRNIIGSVELMKDLTSKVFASSLRQESVGKGLGESTLQMTDVVETIRGSSSAQADGCRRISASVEQVEGSAVSSLESVRIMKAAVDSLTTQIASLQHEIAKLRVS